MSYGQVLKTESDFKNAIKNQLEVSVTQDGEHVGNGIIISQSHHCIQTTNAIYFKAVCEIRVCTMLSEQQLT